MAEHAIERQARIAGKDFHLRSSAVVGALRAVDPEPIASHFVVIGNRRFPPKQVIGLVTGLDRADFTTHQARRTLMRLGFPVGRRSGSHATASGTQPVNGAASTVALAEHLRPLAGQWVALKDDDVIYAAATPQRLVGWLTEHGQKADSMFRVPEDALAASGLAPL